MREVTVIMRRELRSYFASPIAYVFGALFLFAIGLVCTEDTLRNNQQASMQVFFSWLPVVFLIFLPALTMRSWAEERKMGSIELLMTFPVTVTQLILGKFFASMAYLALIMVLTLCLPLTVSMFGDLDWGPVLSAYLASFLMAAAYLSVGMFCSSVTRDQIVALLVAVVLLLALFYLGYPRLQITLSAILPGFVVEMINAISPYKYFNSIARGVLDTRDFLYYACFCGFFLHLNYLVLQGRRMKG